MTTVVVVFMYATNGRWRASENVDADVRRVGHDVVHRRTLLGLRDDRLDLVGRRIGIDVEGHPDLAEAVANVGVDAQDALDVHVALERRGDPPQLDLAVLRDRG